MNEDYILRTERLCRNFGALKATNDVSIKVPRGEVRAIIGPNGAGKSTLMDVIINRTHATSGRIYFDGIDITNMPPYKIANKGLYKCFQINNFFPKLTVFENVQAGLIKKKNRIYDCIPKRDDYLRDEVLEVLSLVGMEKHIDEVAAFMSYGDQRRLEIAITLAMDPKLLILDEPTSGVARAEGYEIMETVRDLAKTKNITVIFIEHDMDVVFKYADTITILANGSIIISDSPEIVRQNAFVQEAYIKR